MSTGAQYYEAFLDRGEAIERALDQLEIVLDSLENDQVSLPPRAVTALDEARSILRQAVR